MMGEHDQYVICLNGALRIGIARHGIARVTNGNDDKLILFAQGQLGPRSPDKHSVHRHPELADLQVDLVKILIEGFVVTGIGQ